MPIPTLPNDPQPHPPSPTGQLFGSAMFFWNGTAWQASGDPTGGGGGAGTGVVLASVGYSVSDSFARPADVVAYAAGDVVGGARPLALIGPAAGTIMLAGASLLIEQNALPAGSGAFRLALYAATPPSALADNAPFNLATADRALFRGFVDVGAPALYGDSLYAGVAVPNWAVKLTGTGLFYYLITTGGFTPTASIVYRPSVVAIAL